MSGFEGRALPAGVAQSSVFAVALLAELLRQGVRDFVVCPGSRSQALAFAAAEAERAGVARLHVRTDERSAAFFALGVARETGVPAPVIVTSGTAVANLLPAALEAHEGRVPFIALTADRPVELRGVRSNQTTRQAGVFGSASRLSLDVDVEAVAAAGVVRDRAAPVADDAPGPLARRAMAAALGRAGGAPAGPVQLDLAFREPLSGWPEGAELDFGAGAMTPAELFRAAIETDEAGSPLPSAPAPAGSAIRRDAGGSARTAPVETLHGRGWHIRREWSVDEVYTHEGDALAVVVAGADAGPEAEAFAHAAGLPLLAEAVSGVRFGREAIGAYATLIDDPGIGGLAERAIVFGHPTLTRQVPALLKRDDVDVVVVDPHTGEGVEHFGSAESARVVRAAVVADSYDPRGMRRWLGAWVVADRELLEQRSTVHQPDTGAATATGYKERSAYARAELAALREPVTRELLCESVWRASWPHDRLVLGASRLVRVLDGIAPARRLEVRSNRGLAGIDGTVATALGVAVSSQASDDPAQAAGATRVILGDLALLHDAGSLLLPECEERPRIQLFVGVDGGGTIFDTLEAAATSPRDAFERVMYTPQRADLAALAAAYGWQHRRVETRGELSGLLTEPVLGPTLVEIPLDR